MSNTNNKPAADELWGVLNAIRVATSNNNMATTAQPAGKCRSTRRRIECACLEAQTEQCLILRPGWCQGDDDRARLICLGRDATDKFGEYGMARRKPPPVAPPARKASRHQK